MRFRVQRDVLAEAVTWVARALPARPRVHVLAGMLLEASPDGVLRLSSFDYYVSARVEAVAEVGDSGTVLVSGRLLADICRSLPNQPVDFATDGSHTRVTCGTSKFTLLTMPVDDYPSLPAAPGRSGTVPGDVFAQAVAQVSVAAARDDTLQVLAGVLVEAAGSELTLTATDRYRLAVRTIPWAPAAPGADVTALIRARTLTEAAKSFGGGDVTVGLSGDLAAFEAGARRSTSLLVDGEYPKVRALFPGMACVHAVVRVDGFTAAVKRVALVAERHTPVWCTFTDGTVTLEAGQGEDAQASEAVAATWAGADGGMAQSYNPQFLLDGLGALTYPYARLSFTAPGKPVVITGQAEAQGDDDDDSYRYLLMPVRQP